MFASFFAFFLEDHVSPPFSKLSTNGFFATNRKMNNLELSPDDFSILDPYGPYPETFQNVGENRSIFKFGAKNKNWFLKIVYLR